MRASSIPQWSLVSVLFSALSFGCMVDEDGDGDLEDRETPSGLSTITPSSIWAPVLNGQKVVAITAEENGEKTYYNFDYASGTWWVNAGASFDDLSPTHPWMKLSLVGGMRPWGSDVNGNRVSGPMTAGYVYTDARGVDMFTFMNRDKYWVMCTANCATVNKNLLDELFSKSLDELAMSDPNHPWVRLRRLNGSHAWTGNGITAAFQHPDGRFFLFNDGEYWVLRTSAQGLYPEQVGARLVHDLTGGVMWRVSAAEALSPLNMYAESIVLLDGKRWVEFDQSFRPMGNEGSDVSNLMSCLRWREGCSAELVELPWACDEGYMVTQGNDGDVSHHGKERYAFDFGAPEGAEVRAVRGGTVKAVRATSDTGGCDVRFINDANYVVIDHGDGTSALYNHLQASDEPPVLDTKVEVGDVIGRVGHTGYTCGANGGPGAHLHLQVQESCDSFYCQSVPTEFEGHGVPTAGEIPVRGC